MLKGGGGYKPSILRYCFKYNKYNIHSSKCCLKTFLDEISISHLTESAILGYFKTKKQFQSIFFA